MIKKNKTEKTEKMLPANQHSIHLRAMFQFISTYSSQMFHFYIPTFGFLRFQGGLEMEHWAKMG